MFTGSNRKKTTLWHDKPWHNPENRVITGGELETLIRIKTKPSGQRLLDYRKAFVHSSYSSPASPVPGGTQVEAIIPLQLESNERLEFLGDAVLDLIVAEYLYERYPTEDEGFLTQMRISLVNGKMLARLGRMLDIQKYLLLSFSNEHLRQLDNIVEDTLEAFVGAMFMDRGLKGTKEWFVTLVEENLDFAQLVSTSERDMLSRLYRDKFGKDVQIISTRLSSGVYRVKFFDNDVLLGEGTGPNRRVASDNAARKGLEIHGIDHIISASRT
jgi:ribonuclease-3